MRRALQKIKELPTGLLVLLATAGAAQPFRALAEDANQVQMNLPTENSTLKGLDTAAGKANYNTVATIGGSNLTSVVAQLVSYALGLLGVIFVIITIYAGFLWLTAQGNEEQVTKARKMLTNAAIGIAIISFSYVVTLFVTTALTKTTGVTVQ